MGLYDFIIDKTKDFVKKGFSGHDYKKANDPEALKEYIAQKKAKRGLAKVSMEDSWQFLHEVAHIVEKNFPSLDKNQVYELGGLLFQKYKAQYIHVKEYGVRDTPHNVQSTEQSKDSGGISR